jgi:DNA polymerase delta subunit 3
MMVSTHNRDYDPMLTFSELMQGMSEDEGDVEDAPEVVVDDAKNEAARKAREARQEKLRKMMEDDGRPKRFIVRSFLILLR